LASRSDTTRTPARRDQAERDPEVSGRRLDDDRILGERALRLGRLHHCGGGLQFDRPREIESLAFEVQWAIDDMPQIDVKVVDIEILRRGDYRHTATFK
jgi:hypothetical protein